MTTTTTDEVDKPAITDHRLQPLHLVVSRWLLLIVVCAIALPWLVTILIYWREGNQSSAAKATGVASAESAGSPNVGKAADPPQQWVTGKLGPWGRIETMLFAIDLPDEFVFVPPADYPPVRWSFPGSTKEQASTTLRAAGLSEAMVDGLSKEGKWSVDGGVTAVEPGDRLILSLAPGVRAKLYEILVDFPQNVHQIDPIWFRPDNVDWRLQDCGLAPTSVQLLKKLLYPHGDSSMLFADFEPALRQLPNDAERKRFMKAVSRKRAILARLKIEPDTDVEKVAQYWGIGGRRKDIQPFLTALHRVEAGCTLNLLCILPDFPRDHLYRYPFSPADGKSVKQDCFWSAFNFFRDPPEDRFNDMAYVGEVLKQEYYRIQNGLQLGDLVFLTTESDTVIHAAVYVADDLVFTKNGEAYTQPWILMRLQDMVETYAVRYAKPNSVKVVYYRKKDS